MSEIQTTFEKIVKIVGLFLGSGGLVGCVFLYLNYQSKNPPSGAPDKIPPIIAPNEKISSTPPKSIGLPADAKMSVEIKSTETPKPFLLRDGYTEVTVPRIS